MKTQKFTAFVAASLSLALLLTGCSTPISKASAIKEASNAKELSGTVEAKEIDVNTKIPGRVIELKVAEGTDVQAGDLLAKIDDSDLLAQKNKVLAEIAAAEGELAKAKAAKAATDAATQAALSKAQAGMVKAQGDADLAKTTYERMKKLHEEKGISDQQFDSTENTYKAAIAGLQAAESDLAAAQAARLQVDVYDADIQRANAAIANGKADLQLIENNLAETNIKAPVSGTVTSLNAKQGELVSQGLPLLTITNYADNWVNVKVGQDLLTQITEGQKASVMPVGTDEKTFEGKVLTISKKPDFATTKATNEQGEKDIINYNVKVQVNTPELHPGMNVRVTFSE